MDLWGKMAEMALCFWLYQPARTFGWFPMAMLLVMLKKDNVQRMFIVQTSKWQSQVNQQNHMVANKFDPRMDPVVVQVIHIIALKYIPQFLKFLTQQHTLYISPSSLGSASFVKI